jgi:haloacid dehalogenase-like hydrolase
MSSKSMLCTEASSGLTQVIDEHTDRLVWYGEPVPELAEDLEAIMGTSVPIQKYILLAPVDVMQVCTLLVHVPAMCAPRDRLLQTVSCMTQVRCVSCRQQAAVRFCLQEQRPAIESALGDRAHITTALPGMLEVQHTSCMLAPERKGQLEGTIPCDVGKLHRHTWTLDGNFSLWLSQILPQGASKGDGLRRLLEMLDIDPKNVMAMGDGENDVEMAQMVRIHWSWHSAAMPRV